MCDKIKKYWRKVKNKRCNAFKLKIIYRKEHKKCIVLFLRITSLRIRESLR